MAHFCLKTTKRKEKMIDFTKYSLGIDTWEGSLDIDEKTIKIGGVEYIIIRMNDTVGGIHLDSNFKKQWEESSGFGRLPYVVIAPWIYADAQAKFIVDNMPQGCKKVVLDVELHYNETPAQYSALLKKIISLLKLAGITAIIYTAQWCLPFLSEWPKENYYWWAAYINALYPNSRINITWEEAKKIISQINWLTYKAPGIIVMWQCGADRWILPGTANRAMDINIIPRYYYDELFGKQETPANNIYIPIVMNNYSFQLTSPYRYSRILPEDNAKLAKFYVYGSKFTVVEKWGDWGKLVTGAWIRINQGVKVI
jgi:hypothetical protein